MQDAPKKYQEHLEKIKKNIKLSYTASRENVDRFNAFRDFIFNTTLSSDDLSILAATKKPQIECNGLEAYISRNVGEFCKQEPSISVEKNDIRSKVDPKVIDTLEGYMRYALSPANSDDCEGNIYKDMLSGGFSVGRVFTQYVSPMSFDQVALWKRVFDPTLCGFDPLAMTSHKGDGAYCFELFPKSREEFEAEYGKEYTESMQFTDQMEGFNWSYENQSQEQIVLMCAYYAKKKKKVKIVELPGKKVITLDQYNEFIQQWKDRGELRQPPVIVQQRTTEKVIIVRYIIVENRVLEYKETIFEDFPLVNFAGNTVRLRVGPNGPMKEMSRPYIYHAKGVQKLKNFAIQNLGNELENMVQHKYMAAKEGIPIEYIDAYTDYQIPNVLIYNAFKDNDPNVPLPAPQAIARTPIPPEIMATFSLCDQAIQTNLGSFDADMGKIPTNAISGIAIQETITQSNAAAMPYIIGYLNGLNQIGKILLNIIPKIWDGPRSVPMQSSDGKRSYQVINQFGDPNSVNIQYDSNDLNIKVEAGVNFAIQKSRALQQIIALMQASPLFAQFMNQEGLGILLDNIEIRGIDQLKDNAEQFMAQMKQQQAMQHQMQIQQMKQGAQQNPLIMKNQIEQAKVQQSGQKMQIDAQQRAEQMSIDRENTLNDRLEILADMKADKDETLLESAKNDTERFVHEIGLHHDAKDMEHRHALDTADMHHRHAKDTIEVAHKLSQPKGESKNGS